MNPALVWIVIGVLFCLMEVWIPSAFLESTFGISAFGVALLSLVVTSLNYQIVLWMR
ncbi:NfeD family protein [Synechococcus sp. PCC 7335]|uniref:NfeD family protein n=1 Tax=Synechococcus sp. (strain ATCC 29403 / PCC 7335) TaxID=91464 RepID=UPI000303AD3D|nr:hypothetical protein [Synechococcus sp. PCC 7335]